MMTPELHIKLAGQAARQGLEADALEPQIAAMQPAIDSAQAWVDSCAASVTSAQAALDALAVVEGADTTEQQAALAAANQTLEAAKSDLSALTEPRDAMAAKLAALRTSIAHCQSLIDAGGLVMTQEEMDAMRLSAARDQVWERIKARRDAATAQGVPVAGKWFHSDERSRIQQLGLVLMGAGVPPVAWKTMDGSFITMSQSLAGQIFQATAARDMTIFGVAEQHRAAVNASANPAAYDFSAGWPAGFTG